jgi:oxygen-independent coproporphyrinogen III oxidase
VSECASAASASDLGVYVHVPFCERVCPYCDFAVEAAPALSAQTEDAYLQGLAREWDVLLARFPELGRRPRATIYLGGGTPSLLSAAGVERILGLVDLRTPCGAGEINCAAGEITLELNPSRTELERLREFRSAGITRLSLGAQSLQTTVLRRLGRAQSGEQVLRAIERASAAGFASLSADLIYGAPGQTEDALLADLDRLIELGVPHVSAYALTLEPGTPFARAHERGQLALPDEETVRRMGRRVRAGLAAAGIEQYEISSFARPGHRSRHNQRYWSRADVIGLGVGAASLLAEQRFQNARERSAWQDALTRGEPAWISSETLSLEEQRRETLALGFRRLDGVSRAQYLRKFRAPPEAHFGAQLRELRALELIEERGGYLRLSERGVLFADEVFLRFVGR